MRTLLSEFCEQFVKTVRPVLDPLGRTLDALESKNEAIDGVPDAEVVRNGLSDLRSQLQLLCDKVAEQRAYVLIFGPLKSGKSTLMNSIAGAYVSEVSSLPAYPCLVFVQNGNKQKFVVTDYRGKSKTFHDARALSDRIEAAHNDLADNIRKAEDQGELFDPQKHFTPAIRRIDVRLPAKNLEESGAVLVDTPGLYTRMRFGYDRMTREFRNAAACAIFVVKSDTLFLEQVFAEFNQLLELFSRVFLVINMDAAKRDVGPDGKLVPSLEQKDPDRIVKAFENLAMPMPLREAAESGRLRIFPVDLMNAASMTLQGKDTSGTDFGKFQKDLDAYLESTDYLTAFLNDSFNRAKTLVAETRDLSGSDFAMAVEADIHDAESHRDACREELRLLGDCQKLDWSPAFKRYEGELRSRIDRVSQDVGLRIARDMSASIETWILSSHSLRWMLETVWQPLIQEYVQAVRDTAVRCFEQSVYQNNAGLDFDADLAHFLESLEIDFRPLRQAAFADLAAQPDAIPEIPLDLDQIPVRRRVTDVVMLRKEDGVRKKLFGKDADNKLSARQKAKRLGEPAKKFLNQFLLGFREDFFRRTMTDTHNRYGTDLQQRTIERLHATLKQREPSVSETIESYEARIATLSSVRAPMQELRDVTEQVTGGVEEISTKFSATDAHAILQPAPRRSSEEPTTEESQQRRTRH